MVAVLKTEVKRITITVPKSFADDLAKHLQNYAFTDKSRWMLDAGRDKLAKEQEMLMEREQEEEM